MAWTESLPAATHSPAGLPQDWPNCVISDLQTVHGFATPVGNQSGSLQVAWL